MKLYTKDN